MRKFIGKSIIFFFVILVLLAQGVSFAGEKGASNIKVHKSNIPLVSEIQEHVLVSGESHSDLWLGRGIVFNPIDGPCNFHFLFHSTDRKGKDSARTPLHFTVPGLPLKAEGFSQWHKEWKKKPYPKALLPRTDEAGYRFVPTFNWKFHKQSGKWLGIGHLLRHKGKHLSDHVEHLEITCSVYDPILNKFSVWDSLRIKVDGKEKPCVASGERVDLPNGDILIPLTIVKDLKGYHSIRWCGSARCRFDGKKLQVLEVSNLFTNPVPRGFVEPSLAEHNGRYYMTLRAQDRYGHVTTSANGLNWSKPKPWSWENGAKIPMDQTQTRFINHSDGLFLIYTRITKDNRKVMRHRAPLFIAQVNPEKVCLIRKTESEVFSNNGFPLGNFKIHPVSEKETWISTQEWDRTGRNIPCDNLLGRIIWKSPNTHDSVVKMPQKPIQEKQ